MAFPSGKGSATGKSKTFGNTIPADEYSNTKGSSGSALHLGPKSPTTKTVSGSNVAGLNKGVATCRGGGKC